MATGKVGHGLCGFGCGGQALYSRSTGGKLKCACTHCDRAGYADQGGTGEAAWLANVDQPAAAPPPAPVPAPPAPPAQRRVSSAFDLGNL